MALTQGWICYPDCWSRHQSGLQIKHLIVRIEVYQKLKTRVNSSSRISCLVLAEIRNHKLSLTAYPINMLLTNVALFKRSKIYYQRHCYNKKKKPTKTEMSLFVVLNLPNSGTPMLLFVVELLWTHTSSYWRNHCFYLRWEILLFLWLC